MAIGAANLLKTGSAATAASYATASVSLTAGRLYLLMVHSRKNAAGTAAIPTVTGAGQTWTQLMTHLNVGTTRTRITVFRCLPTAGGSGALTIDFGGDTQTGAGWVLDEFTGVVLGSNGASAIVQNIDGEDATGAATFGLTLAAFGSAENGGYMVGAGASAAASITPAVGYTELADQLEPVYTGSLLLCAVYKAAGNAPAWTYAVSSPTYGAVAVELAAAALPAQPRSFGSII